MMIQNKISEISRDIKNVIIVLKGFDTSSVPNDNKYFSFELGLLDKLDLSEMKEKFIDEIIENRDFKSEYKWMTIEEYQIFKDQRSIAKNEIVILENNLYDKQYPYVNNISNIQDVYEKLYFNEDNELNIKEKKLLEAISTFYGLIDYSKQSDKYYVTYHNIEESIKIYRYYDVQSVEPKISMEYPTVDAYRIELSDNEMLFLDLEDEIIHSNKFSSMLVILSGPVGNLPFKYMERLDIISRLKNIELYFTTATIIPKKIENEEKYNKILKDVYGYDEFRKIKFYKNIESHSKERVEISQVQLIDDIVTQAEKAMKDEPFRDVYITASTGAGKSVMFQIPALYLVGNNATKPLTLVISPLIGLMNDQVDSMKRKGVVNLATINGNTPPFERENILESIKKYEVDVLYLSPETLQARSDIGMLIGERKIGIVIIDEAHIVTTWGKSFRADYWYLGIYLAKLRKKYKFPIITFTATAIYGGKEDMYLDTRNSLNMINPISYFGDVRRDDIFMLINSSNKDFDKSGRDYRNTKNLLALKHLQKAHKKGEKSLIYFPTIKLLSEFSAFLGLNDSEIAKKTGKYHGKLQKEEKDEALNEYKSGEIQFVLATKAFGMGIDIPDITNVYHYAPTGNVVDYIQEIGRASRDKSVVPRGYALIDFLERDFNNVNQLHGMSAIRKDQILEVMKKILSVYKEKGNNRNLIISPEDFKYIFVQGNSDEDSLDNKVKTVLLMIEKDFSSPNKLGYSPFVARPRSLFGNDMIFVTPEFEKVIEKSRLSNYFTKEILINSNKYEAVYNVDLAGIWEKYYKNYSYPSFKHLLFSQEERDKLYDRKLFDGFIYTTGIEVSIGAGGSKESILVQYRLILQAFEEFANDQKLKESQFTVTDLGTYLMKRLKIADKFEARAFSQAIVNSIFEFQKVKNSNFIKERANSAADNQRYILYQDADIFTSFILEEVKSVLYPENNCISERDSVTAYIYRTQAKEIDAKMAALGIGEARKILSYQLKGGNNPQIYIRMNSVYPLEKSIKQGDFYKNDILQDIQNKHYTSVEMLKYLFTKDTQCTTAKEKIIKYTNWFWDQIEDYFMGVLPEEVKETLARKR